MTCSIYDSISHISNSSSRFGAKFILKYEMYKFFKKHNNKKWIFIP